MGERPVLVVDDDFEIRAVLAEILEDAGHPVVLAANGLEAMNALRGGLVPAVILLDLMMPVMDGWEFCKQWRADPEISRFPVIIVSAHSRADAAAAASGATGSLQKPIELEDLLRTVNRFRG